MSLQQVQHLYEYLQRDIPFNPAQTDQCVQMEEPHLPDFLYHFEEDKVPVPCFAMTNPYEAIFSPDMLHSFQPPTAPPSPSDQGIDVWYPQGSVR